ncbi:MAG: hypothetical protein G3M70_06870 [Candidatus Nitronauta litoralis]|uniref:Uncharacterized protein n=1 Tax=Candidatus Nitronauta litoralis TaxID=2705533 RepID=A0A7T0BV76_9BACT|nr:MAG: hypothetical protein G3M70_06870 [Candidatus Nitronauta litoralis]
MGDTAREANSTKVRDFKKENTHLKEFVAKMALKNRFLKREQGLNKFNKNKPVLLTKTLSGASDCGKLY